MPHVCSYPGRGAQSPLQSCNWRQQSFCSRLGRYPIGFGAVHLVKALCKWVHLMIQLNMIKKNKAIYACSVSLSLVVSASHTHTHTLCYPGPFTLPTHASLCGSLRRCVVILTRPTTHADSLNLLQSKCPQSESRTLTTPTEKHPAALRAANPL